MKRLLTCGLIASFALMVGAAHAAQEDRSTFQSGVTSNLASGTTITAAELRKEITDLSDSCFFINDETSDDLTEGATKLLMTTSERSKLSGIEASATADQTGAEIKALYEAESDTNAFTDAEQTKLSGLPSTITESFIIPASAESGNLTTGTGVVKFRMPYAFTLTGVRASVGTAPTGSTVTVDINEGGVSVLSTELTIDATEKTSTTAATPVVISDSALADDAEITIDIDAVGSTVAGEGLKITLIGNQ